MMYNDYFTHIPDYTELHDLWETEEELRRQKADSVIDSVVEDEEEDEEDYVA